MNKQNKICLCCGKSYSYCTNCNSVSPSKYWMNVWDTKNCQGIFMIVSDYIAKKITKEDAYLKLKDYDLSNYEKFRTNIKETIDEIKEINMNTKTETVDEVKPSTDLAKFTNTVENHNFYKNKKIRK